MPRNGSGVYSLPSNSFNPAVEDTDIDPAAWNASAEDLESALTDSIAKNGVTTPTANLPMGNFKHTSVGPASSLTQYSRADQVWLLIDDSSVGTATNFTVDSISSDFNNLRITFQLRPTTDGSALRIVTREGAGTDQTSFRWTRLTTQAAAAVIDTNDSDTSVTLSLTTSNSSTAGFASGTMVIHNIQNATNKHGECTGSQLRSATSTIELANTVFQVRDTTAITGFRFAFSTGTIAAGRVRVEGC